MAVEDHPDYPEWAQALDDLKAAKDALAAARLADDTSQLTAATNGFRRALANYNAISDRIDA